MRHFSFPPLQSSHLQRTHSRIMSCLPEFQHLDPSIFNDGIDKAEDCSPSLSWDGVLCDMCRQCFDEILIHSRSLKHLKRNGQTSGIKKYLWHSINGIKQCSTNQCRFCSLVFALWNEEGGHVKWKDQGTDGYKRTLGWSGRLELKILASYDDLNERSRNVLSICRLNEWSPLSINLEVIKTGEPLCF